ncbi:DUF4157 domain-containing protein, partial [Hydrocoleum sp. CS-953]|uniref:eCIS core domain-containing protein n=1 Tax=Hydrocoleum sp. CS-953 TaxID=1671698 RepID=UPI00352A5846
MESRFGADFGNVRVHTGSQSVQMNKELGAQAFTHGNDVYFNSGKFNPGSSSGKELLAHELTHTIQQTGGVQAKLLNTPAEGEREKTQKVGKVDVLDSSNKEQFKTGDRQLSSALENKSPSSSKLASQPESKSVVQEAKQLESEETTKLKNNKDKEALKQEQNSQSPEAKQSESESAVREQQ